MNYICCPRQYVIYVKYVIYVPCFDKLFLGTVYSERKCVNYIVCAWNIIMSIRIAYMCIKNLTFILICSSSVVCVTHSEEGL